MIGIALALSHTAVSSCPSQKITSGRGRGLPPPVPPLQLAATPLHVLPSSSSVAAAAAADWGGHVGSSGNSQLALEGVPPPLPLEVDLIREMGEIQWHEASYY